MNRSRLLFTVGIVCLVLLALAMITRINIHSDSLFFDALMDDLFVTHGAWSAWRFSPAPSYFPDMLVYGIAYFVFDSAAWRIWFVTVVQIAVIAVLTDRLVIRVRPTVTCIGRGLVLAANCGLVAVANHTTTAIGIFFNANNIQVPTLISSLLLLIMTIDLIERRRYRITLAGIMVFGALAYASSTLFLLSFTIPCLAALLAIVVLQIDVGATRMNLLGAASAIVASQCLGWLLSGVLTRNAPLEGRLSLDAGRALSAWHHFQDATANIVAPDNLWSAGLFGACFVAWITSCAAAMRLLALRRSNTAGGSERLVLLFVVCSSITSIGGAIGSGGFGDLYGYRYFMTFAAVSVVWALARFDRGAASGRSSALWVSLGVIVLTATSLRQTIAAPQRDLAAITRHGAIENREESIARCLAALIEQRVPLQAGIADYWAARGVSYHLGGKPRIEPVTADLDPFFWISSLGPLEHPQRYGIKRYNFAILRRALPEALAGYDLPMMRLQMPEGYETHRCDEADADVLVFGNDALDDKVRLRFENFVFRKNGVGRLRLFGAELPSQIGSVDAGSKVADGGVSGYLIFGPYIHLDSGRYRLEVRYSAKGAANSPSIATVDVGNFSVPPALPFAKGDIPTTSNGTLELGFVVPAEGAINVETRVFFAGSGRLQVDSIDIVRVND